MVTRLINLMGAYIGPEHHMLGFDDWNPKGYWERRDVMIVNDAILVLYGCTWDMLADWRRAQPSMVLPDLVFRMRSIVLNMDAFRPWVLKDPRLCLTLPWWMPLLEVPVAVLLYRDPLEITRSLNHRNGMTPRSASPSGSITRWVR